MRLFLLTSLLFASTMCLAQTHKFPFEDIGLDAAKPVSCTAPYFYNAIDTNILYFCTNAGSLDALSNGGNVSGPQCNTSSAVGADVGAKISYCINTTLAGGPGTVRIDQGGTWTTTVTVPSGIHIIQDAKSGAIVNGLVGTRQPLLLMNSNTSLFCESLDASIGAPTTGDEVIVCGVDQTSSCSNTAQSLSNVHVDHCHFKSQGSPGSPLDGTIWLENCVNCTTNGNFFDGIHNIQIVVGASSSLSKHSQYYQIRGNYSTGANNASFAIINGSQIDIGDNLFCCHGTGAAGEIDVEPNGATDYVENIDIHDNTIDGSQNTTNFVDYGITFQCAGYTHCKFNKVHDNFLWGGEPGAATGPLNQGIATEGSYVEVYNNVITSTNSVGLQVGGDHGYYHDNTLYCTSFLVNGVSLALPATLNRVFNNKVDNSSCGLGRTFYTYSTLQEGVTAGLFADHNVYRGNHGFIGYNLSATSRLLDDEISDGSGLTFRMPSGFAGGHFGTLDINQLGTPTAPIQGGTAGTCNGGFTANTYFYKWTAVDANGNETACGAEASWAAGGANGCFTVYVTQVPGANCYNLYRSTTTNTEQLITSSPICGGSTLYPDIGGQTPGRSCPAVNSTGGVQLPSLPVGNLPSATTNTGPFYVNDSTAIATEGQTCTGGSSNKAVAISNGTIWKCF